MRRLLLAFSLFEAYDFIQVVADPEPAAGFDLCFLNMEWRNVMAAKFEWFQDKAGKYRFRLKAGNGEIIATSEAYNAKDSCMNGIESVKKNAPVAEIVEAKP